MKLVCTNCELKYRQVKTGQLVELMTDAGHYQIFSSDIFECPGCRHQIARTAESPVSEHWRSDYATYRPRVTNRFWVTEKERATYLGAEDAEVVRG